MRGTNRFYEKTLELDPGNTYASCTMYYNKYHLCDWRDYDRRLANIIGILDRQVCERSFRLIYLSIYPSIHLSIYPSACIRICICI